MAMSVAGQVGDEVKRDLTSRSSSFLWNILALSIFSMLYFNGIFVTIHQNITNIIVSFIIITHIVRALYSLRKYKNDVYVMSLAEFVVNAVVYVGTAFSLFTIVALW